MPLVADSLRSLHAALVIFAITVAGLVLGKSILVPLALATVFAFILSPLVRAMTKRGVPKAIAAGLVFVGVLGTTIASTVIISSQILQLTAELSTYRQNLVEKVRFVTSFGKGEGVLKKAGEAVDMLESAVRRELSEGQTAPVQPGAQAPSSPAPQAGVTPPPPATQTETRVVVREEESTLAKIEEFIGPAAKIGITLIFTLFLLLQYQDLRDRVVRLAGVDNLSGTTAAMSDAGTRLSRMLLAQALLNLGFGIVVAVALFFIGVPNAILWGVLAALMRFVPFIGSFIAAVPPILLAAGVEPGWSMALATLAFFVMCEPILGHFIEPMVLGKHGGISPFAMVVAATFWTLVWGPIGLILAAPLTLVLVVLGRYMPALEFFSVLLGDEAALKADEEMYGRVLSKDSVTAMAQLEKVVDETSLARAVDDIVIPALALAAADHRRGRIDRARMDDVIATMREVGSVADVHRLVRTCEPVAKDAPRVLVIAARGPVDGAAAEFAARTIAAVTEWNVSVARADWGLTALASRGGLPKDAALDAVLIVTVGGVDERHLDILVKRAAAQYAQCRVLTLEPVSWLEDGKAFGTDLPSVSRRHALVEIVEALQATKGGRSDTRGSNGVSGTAREDQAA